MTEDTEMEEPQRLRDTELERINQITERIIGCAIEVHRVLRCGLFESVNPVFDTQVLTYLRVAKKRVGLLINFNSRVVRDGVKRLIV
jgi:hypothetical protein